MAEDEQNVSSIDRGENQSPENKEALREIERTIVSAIIFSKDGKILMGRKNPSQGGVYSDCWHIPGGGLDENEDLEAALVREVREETGLNITDARIVKVPEVGEGVAEKTLKDTGERVLARMKFNRFEVYLDKVANEIELKSGDDLENLQWFSPEELVDVQQIPGGREFFEQKGYMPKQED